MNKTKNTHILVTVAHKGSKGGMSRLLPAPTLWCFVSGRLWNVQLRRKCTSPLPSGLFSGFIFLLILEILDRHFPAFQYLGIEFFHLSALANNAISRLSHKKNLSFSAEIFYLYKNLHRL